MLREIAPREAFVAAVATLIEHTGREPGRLTLEAGIRLHNVPFLCQCLPDTHVSV